MGSGGSISRRRGLSSVLAFVTALVTFVVAGPAPAQAANLFVDNSNIAVVCDDGTGAPFCTVAAAVNSAGDNDTIQVAAGTYPETATIQMRGKNLTLIGAGSGSTIIDRTATPGRVMNIFGAFTYSVTGVTITGGNSGGSMGAGVAIAPEFIDSPVGPQVTMVDVAVTNNASTSNGGGIELNQANLIMNDSLVDGNSSGASGGGIYVYGTDPELTVFNSVVSNNVAVRGAGLAQSSGTVTIDQSAISRNSVPLGAGQGGGGLYVTDLGGVVTNTIIGNTTVTENFAGGQLGGGGIYFQTNLTSSHVLNNVTITNNFTDDGGTGTGNGGGGLLVSNDTPLTISNSVIAGNLDLNGGAPDCRQLTSAAINSIGNNFIGDNTFCGAFVDGANGDQVGTTGAVLDPMLTPVETPLGILSYEPMLGSPLIDAGSTVAVGVPGACEPVDQNGVARFVGLACDIGSIEFASATPLQDMIDLADPGDDITVPAGTYNERIIIGDGKTLQALPGPVTIDATGLGGSAVTAGNGDFGMDGITITGGNSPNQGGGILVDGGLHFVTLRNTTITGNAAALDGGGIWIDNGNTLVVTDSVIDANVAGGNGGGVYSAGSDVTLDNATVSNNSSSSTIGDGGGLFMGAASILTVQNSSLAQNSGDDGGAVYSNGDVVVNGSDFVGNSADRGAAIYLNFTADSLMINAADPCVVATDVASFVPLTTFVNNTSTGSGGAIFHNTRDEAPDVVYGALFENNDSGANGGGVFIESGADPLDVGCSVFTLNDAIDGGGAIGTEDSGALFVSNTLFDTNTAKDGGAISDPSGGNPVTVTGSAFTNNSAVDGGAINVTTDTSIVGSEFTANTASGNGGAIHTEGDTTIVDSMFDGNTALTGGAMYNFSGSTTIERSTLSNNEATATVGTTGGGVLVSSGTLVAENSTFSGNISRSSGGALGMLDGIADLNHVTIYGNQATAPGGGAAFFGESGEPGSLVTMANSITAGNFGGSGTQSCSQYVSGGYNVHQAFSCTVQIDPTDTIAGSLAAVAIDAVLADNGGPTFTHVLQAGSPAIDAGDPGNLQIELQTSIGNSGLTANGLNGLGASIGTTTITPVSGEFLAGSIWASAPDEGPHDLNQGFSTTFDFEITQPMLFGGEASGDGFTFAIASAPTVLGEFGGRLGVATTPGPLGTVSVEFDTYANAGEPSGNHIGINVGGFGDAITQAVLSDVQVAIPGSFDDGATWTAWVDYYADSDVIEVRVASDGIRPAAAQLSHVVDIAAEVGQTGYYGFTGGTGLAYATHTITAWELYATTCPSVDQRGVDRPIGDGCDSGAFEAAVAPPVATEVQISLVNDNSVGLGSQIIPIDGDSASLYLDIATGPAASQLGAIQLGAIQLGAIQLGAIQLGAIGEQAPIGYLDMSTLVEASAQLEAAQLGAIGPVDQILLVDIPIPGGWETILALSPTLAGRPSYTVTLAEALAAPAVAAAVAPLKLFESGITASQLGAIPLEVYALGSVRLDAIQLGAIQLGAIDAVMDDLCSQIDCVAYAIDPDDPTTYEEYSLMSLSLLGADLSPLQLGAIQLGAIDLTGVQLGAIQLGAIDLAASQLGAIQLGAIQLGAIQLGAIDLTEAQLGAIQLGAIDLDTAPDDGTVSTDELEAYWCSAAGGLDCSNLPKDAAGDPDLSNYSIVALAAMGADLNVLQLGAIQLGAIQLGAIDVNGSQLGAIQLGAIDIENSQLGAIQLGAIQLGAIQLGAIQLGAIQLGAIQLGAIQLGAIDLTASQLGAIQLGAIQLGAIQLGAIDGIVNCSALEGRCEAHPELTLQEADALGILQPLATLALLEGVFGELTLTDLEDGGIDLTQIIGTISDLLPETTVSQLPPDLTLEDIKELVGATTLLELLLALMDPTNLDWQDLDPTALAEEAPLSLQGMSTYFSVIADPADEPGAALPFTAELQLNVPDGVSVGDGFGIAKDPDTLPIPTVPLGEPTIDGNTYTWILDGIEANANYVVQFGIGTLLTADESQPLSAQVTALGVTGDALFGVTVVENEPNDTFGTAVPLTEPSIALGLVDSASDVDMYQVEVGVNGQVSAFLNTGGADLDLVLFEPADGPNARVRPGDEPEQVVDGSLDPIIGNTDEQDQESLADIINTDLAPVYKASLHRGDAGEQIVTPPLAAPGTYYLQVTGYNGDVSAAPYSLYVQVIDQENRGPCNTRVFTYASETFAATPLVGPNDASLAGAETLFIINEARFSATHGEADLALVQASLTTLLTDDGTYVAPKGAVLPIDQDPTVAGAYAAWDADRCNPGAANTVVDAIADLVDNYRAANPTISSIVLVGSDDLIPHARVRDNATIANEREYANEFAGNNELVGALASGMVLTDDPYVDENPLSVPQGNREVFVPTIAVGRLVESPVEIKAALDQYVFSGGYLNMATSSTATVFGYDFLADMAIAVSDVLTAESFVVDLFNSETWTDVDWTTAVSEGAALISSNAHYDHDEGLPALSNSGATADLFGLGDLPTSLAGSIIYSVGCHSGLSAPGAYLAPTDDRADWAQALLARDAVYVANTGFGYGDDTFVGYSEALMLEMTENFAVVNTIGEALMFAKQQRALDTFAWSPYDDKALMESTLYGLPFYKLHGLPVPPPTPPALTPTTVDTTGLDSSTINSSGTLPAPVVTDDGSYIPSDTLIQVPFRPVEPADSFDVTAENPDVVGENLVARGAVVEGMSSFDTSGVNALYARAVLYDADLEPEVETDGPFPTILTQIRRGTNLFGDRDLLILARGRYFPSTMTQRNLEDMSATVYYVAPGADSDITPPQIALSSAVEVDGQISFEVTATDADSGISRAVILYKAAGAQGQWEALDLSPGTGDQWVGNAPGLGTDAVYWVQVVSGSGLVSFSSDKGDLHVVEQPGPPTVTVTKRGSNGWTVGVAEVTATPPANAPAVALEYKFVGDTDFTPYAGPVSLPEGSSDITFRPADVTRPDSAVVIKPKVDTIAPTVTIATQAGLTVGKGSSLPFLYSCADAGSGISSCRGPKANGISVNTSQVGTFTVMVQGVDKAGNKATSRLTYTVTAQTTQNLTLALSDGVVPLGTSIEATGAFDATSGQTVTWSWGDGTSCANGVATPVGAATCSGSPLSPNSSTHAHAETGVYVVKISLRHPDGFTESASALAVVYDPAAGFVTGGGWFESPEGAYTPNDDTDPEVGGVAEFGFVSKYKKGSSIPKGNTVFELVSGDFEFHSTSYDWLVVNNAKAQFEGRGTIESDRPELSGTEYGFRVTLRDAGVNTNDSFTEDSFRIKIWEILPAGGTWTIYDSGRGSDDQATHGGTTALGGGSIKIHVPKGKAK